MTEKWEKKRNCMVMCCVKRQNERSEGDKKKDDMGGLLSTQGIVTSGTMLVWVPCVCRSTAKRVE